jgi:subtilisin family serine protease
MKGRRFFHALTGFAVVLGTVAISTIGHAQVHANINGVTIDEFGAQQTQTQGAPNQQAQQLPSFQAGSVFNAPRFVDGQVLVKYHPGATPAQQAVARAMGGAYATRPIRRATSPAESKVELQALAPGQTVANAIRILQAQPGVAMVGPNRIYTAQVLPDEPRYRVGVNPTDPNQPNGELWGVYSDSDPPGPIGTRNPFGSQAEKVWNSGNVGSRSVYIAILDTGVDFTNPDLDANIWTNPFDPVDGVDNDGNGYADDVHGFDFVCFDNNPNQVWFDTDDCLDDPDDDDDGPFIDLHGTHVAGTIGAEAGTSALS